MIKSLNYNHSTNCVVLILKEPDFFKYDGELVIKLSEEDINLLATSLDLLLESDNDEKNMV